MQPNLQSKLISNSTQSSNPNTSSDNLWLSPATTPAQPCPTQSSTYPNPLCSLAYPAQLILDPSPVLINQSLNPAQSDQFSIPAKSPTQPNVKNNQMSNRAKLPPNQSISKPTQHPTQHNNIFKLPAQPSQISKCNQTSSPNPALPHSSPVKLSKVSNLTKPPSLSHLQPGIVQPTQIFKPKQSSTKSSCQSQLNLQPSPG